MFDDLMNLTNKSKMFFFFRKQQQKNIKFKGAILFHFLFIAVFVLRFTVSENPFGLYFSDEPVTIFAWQA
jgi:hypothetical protein